MKNYPDFLLRKDDLDDGKKWGKDGRLRRMVNPGVECKNKKKTCSRKYFIVIRVVEFSNRGTRLERLLSKNQHTQRKLLNFENWVNEEVSKSAKI